MTVKPGKDSEGDSKPSTSQVEDVYRALIAVKEKVSHGHKTLGTGCAVRTGDVFGVNWRKKYHLLISSSLLSKDTLQQRENRGKYLGEFQKVKPKIELEKASNTLFKEERKDFHFIAIGRGRSGKLSHHVLEICRLERDEVLQGKLTCYVTADANDKNDTHSFKSHEIVYNSQSKAFEATDEFGHDEFPRGAPVLNESHEVVGIISAVSEGKKLEVCFISDKPVVSEQQPPKTEEKIVTEIVVEKAVESQSESLPESQPPESQPVESKKTNGEIPAKPQRASKVQRTQSEKSPLRYKGTGKDRDLRHSFRYSNRNGYKVFVAEGEDVKGVNRWRPKKFGEKKNLFEAKEPVKFLGARTITSPVAQKRHSQLIFNKPRPKLTRSVSLPCNLNETGKPSYTFQGLVQRRVASASNIGIGKYLLKDLPHSVKNHLAEALDNPAKGQCWRKVAIHYGIREAEVNDLAFGARTTKHISGSETKALFHKLELKQPTLTVMDVVDYLHMENVNPEILNMLLPYIYVGTA